MNIIYREIKKSDLIYVNELLQSISKHNPNYDLLLFNWPLYRKQKNLYAIVGIINSEIISFGSIFYEIKIRGGISGHIEDIVVSQSYRGKGLGKELINKLIQNAKKEGCYKVTLSCEKSNIGFYEKIGFVGDQVSMKVIL